MKQICTMKELPISERPYEKCLEYGPSTLSDAELFAVILRNGSQGNSALDLAHRLLVNIGGSHPLAAITRCAPETFSVEKA